MGENLHCVGKFYLGDLTFRKGKVVITIIFLYKSKSFNAGAIRANAAAPPAPQAPVAPQAPAAAPAARKRAILEYFFTYNLLHLIARNK